MAYTKDVVERAREVGKVGVINLPTSMGVALAFAPSICFPGESKMT